MANTENFEWKTTLMFEEEYCNEITKLISINSGYKSGENSISDIS